MPENILHLVKKKSITEYPLDEQQSSSIVLWTSNAYNLMQRCCE